VLSGTSGFWPLSPALSAIALGGRRSKVALSGLLYGRGMVEQRAGAGASRYGPEFRRDAVDASLRDDVGRDRVSGSAAKVELRPHTDLVSPVRSANASRWHPAKACRTRRAMSLIISASVALSAASMWSSTSATCRSISFRW
jgi:hypothetical protein